MLEVWPDHVVGAPKLVVCPSSVETLADDAFRDCRSVEKVVFLGENTIRLFGRGCFQGSGLREAILPSAPLEVREDAFDDCPNRIDLWVEGEGKEGLRRHAGESASVLPSK